jgi:chemotaxis protein methyltransferase CheR
LATDAGQEVLDRARAGIFGGGSLKDLPPSWASVAFEKTEDVFSIRPLFRTGIHFSRQDVRGTVPEGSFDLVSCRNLVFTYFDQGLQAEILERILTCLEPGGCLVIGGHERLPPGPWPLAEAGPGFPLFRKTG